MGSGKSSWCRQWVSKHNKSIWISRDAIRYSILAPGEEYFSREQEVLKEFRRQAQNAIDNEEIDYVLLDASHLSDKSIAKTLKNPSLVSKVEPDFEAIKKFESRTLSFNLYKNLSKLAESTSE